MSDPVREAFEAWHLSKFRYCSSFRKGERYADNLTQARWDDWLAACRAARAAALEEAAQACEGEATIEGIAQRCAARIRAMANWEDER
jgi:hypothetical protein